jgi:CheY-like chemotaxis protein
MAPLKRILLVDDDFDHLLLCSILLKRSGYDIRTMAGCENMDELIDIVSSFQPELIYMDHEMRGICGMDLIRMLKASPQFSGIRVIYFTGREDIVQLTKEAGADGYYRKPFDADGLIAATKSFFV